MDLLTKCPAHGNAHSDFMCPDLRRAKEILGKFYEKERIKEWLNCPNPELDKRTPQSVINEGRIDVVLDMLEGGLMGVTS
ncbi:MAG: DUF2384 domain-containing protein [Candidatus Liptonbacteria bacterium]|nr:DUF2384 domain-containing protein [Candidatus Liptonbacteria bacterium]